MTDRRKGKRVKERGKGGDEKKKRGRRMIKEGNKTPVKIKGKKGRKKIWR